VIDERIAHGRRLRVGGGIQHLGTAGKRLGEAAADLIRVDARIHQRRSSDGTDERHSARWRCADEVGDSANISAHAERHHVAVAELSLEEPSGRTRH
jgi:hypothetical protein